jgi:hypothetical protein
MGNYQAAGLKGADGRPDPGIGTEPVKMRVIGFVGFDYISLEYLLRSFSVRPVLSNDGYHRIRIITRAGVKTAQTVH